MMYQGKQGAGRRVHRPLGAGRGGPPARMGVLVGALWLMSPPQSRETHASEIPPVVQALFAATERGDLAALDTLHTADATVVEGVSVDRGWRVYRDHHLVPELRAMRGIEYRPSEIEAGANQALGWATFRYTLRAELEGRSVDAVGRGTMVLVRVGSVWRVRHLHTSSRSRRPGDAP